MSPAPPDAHAHRRRPGPRGARVRAALTAALAGGLLAGCGLVPSPAKPTSTREPAHHIAYSVVGSGSANEDVSIDYSSNDGSGLHESVPGAAAIWATELTTEPGIRYLTLTAHAASSDLSFSLLCTITVDGVDEGSRGSFGCSHSVDLTAFRTAHPSVSPGATAPARTTTAAPTTSTRPPADTGSATPAGCRFVTTAEAASILFAHDGGVDKPVQSLGGDANRCTYLFETTQGTIRVEWVPRGRVNPLPGTRIGGLGVPGYWLDAGTLSRLDVQLPAGRFSVHVSFMVLPVDLKATAVEIFRTARPRLPR